jgi:hypothetical protein
MSPKSYRTLFDHLELIKTNRKRSHLNTRVMQAVPVVAVMAVARVGRTLLSAGFDLNFVFVAAEQSGLLKLAGELAIQHQRRRTRVSAPHNLFR